MPKIETPMRTKVKRYGTIAVVSLTVNASLLFFSISTYMSYRDYIDLPLSIDKMNEVNRSLKDENSNLTELLNKKTDEMAACVKAVVGMESDFDPMFHSVKEASLMEVTIYSDTESGEPEKFVIRGCEKEDTY